MNILFIAANIFFLILKKEFGKDGDFRRPSL